MKTYRYVRLIQHGRGVRESQGKLRAKDLGAALIQVVTDRDGPPSEPEDVVVALLSTGREHHGRWQLFARYVREPGKPMAAFGLVPFDRTRGEPEHRVIGQLPPRALKAIEGIWKDDPVYQALKAAGF